MADIILRKDNGTITLTKDSRRLLVKTVSAGSGSGLPTTTGNDGYALIEVSGVGAWRPIKDSYIVPAFAISSFSAVASVVEVGASVVQPDFTAAYNRTPDTATLDDDEGSTQKDVISTPTSFFSDETFQKTANNDAVQFTLNADEAGDADSSNANISWQPRTYWGVGVDGLSTEADIEALANNALDNNRQRTFSVTAGAGEHIYYSYPESYGAGTFFVGGFEGGFELVSDSISVTNAEGVTQDYRLYKSTNPNLGTTTVQVV